MLSVSHYPFNSNSVGQPSQLSAPIVLLHGWGCDSQVWQPLLPFFKQWSDVITIDLVYKNKTADSLCNEIIEQLPTRFMLCGWSLGGMLATRLAARYPEKVDGLITLASNASFVARDHWPDGMPVDTYEGFYSLFQKSAKQGLKRFSLLQVHGDVESKQQMQWLQSLSTTNNNDDEDLLVGLDLLASMDNCEFIPSIACSSLYLFGEKDTLVSVQSAQAVELLVSSLNSSAKETVFQKIEVAENCGHVLPYSLSTIEPLLDNFLQRLVSTDVSQA